MLNLCSEQVLAAGVVHAATAAPAAAAAAPAAAGWQLVSQLLSVQSEQSRDPGVLSGVCEHVVSSMKGEMTQKSLEDVTDTTDVV